MTYKKTENPLPSIEKIQEICSFLGEPMNDNILLFNCVTPMVTYSGTSLPEDKTSEDQKEINNRGLTLVHDCERLGLKAGTKVLVSSSSHVTLQKVHTIDELVDNLDPKLVEDYKNNTGRFVNLPASIKSQYHKKYLLLYMHYTSVVTVIR